MKNRSVLKPLIAIAGATILTSSLSFYYWTQEHRPPILEVYLFDLKSGRSMFIRTPEDKRVLIDGGSNSEIIKHISDIMPFYSRRIDVVIATNDLGKNVGGLIDVVDRYDVGRVYIPKYTLDNINLASSTDEIFDTFIQTTKNRNLDAEAIESGRVIDLDSQVSLKIIFPADPKDFVYSKSSAPEILFTLTYGANSLLFAGNSTPKIQKYIASSTASLKNVDFVVVSHSASSQSFAQGFIDKYHPKSIIYSKSLSGSSSKAKAKDPKKKDPLEYLDPENLINIKERGGVKLEFDGKEVKVL